MFNIEATARGANSMSFLVFQRDHLRSTLGIICGSGSFAVQCGDHLWPGILCGAVPAALTKVIGTNVDISENT